MAFTTKIHQEQLRDMVVLRSGNQVISGVKTFGGTISVESGVTITGTLTVEKPISGGFLDGNLLAFLSGHESGSLDARMNRFGTNAYGVGSNLLLSGSAASGHVEIVGSGGVTCIVNQNSFPNKLIVGLDASGNDLTFDTNHPFVNARFSGEVNLTGSLRTSGSWLNYGTPIAWLSGGSQPLASLQGHFKNDLYDGSLSIRAGSKVGTDRSMQFFVYQENVSNTGQFEFLIATSGWKNGNEHFLIKGVSGIDPVADCPGGTVMADQLILDITPVTGNLYDEIFISGATGTDFYGNLKIIKDKWIEAQIPMSGTNFSGHMMIHSGTTPADIPTPSVGFVTLWLSGITDLCIKDTDGNVRKVVAST